MNNTKLLVIFSFIIIFAGLVLVWFGLRPTNISPPTVLPSPSKILSSPNSETIATQSGVQGIEGERGFVTKVVDGDTIDVTINGQPSTVRFIGIDTPETVDPRRPVGCFGKEASNETKKLLTGKTVILQKDITNTDKYSRLLRYIYLPLEDGSFLFVNDYLVREGFAHVYTYPPDVKFNERFREAEKEARENNRGLWGLCK